MKNLRFYLILLLFVNISFSDLGRAEQIIRISTGFTAPVSTYYKKLFEEINRRYSQYHFQFEELPAERSLILANSGVNDGECCRIPAIVTQQYHNLVAVPQVVYSIKWVAFSNKPISFNDWKDIKPYNAVTVTGWKLAEKQLSALKPSTLEVVRSPDIMMRLLNQNRADVGVMGYISGLKSIYDTGSSRVKYISKPLSVSPLYLMLNKKHKEMIPALTKILETFKKDGTLERLYRETIKTYNQSSTH